MLLLLAKGAYAQQMDTYSYQRELQGITEQWHTIVLPDAIFGKISPDLADIRIFGIDANNDTIEAPYLLQVGAEKISHETIAFKQLNTARNQAGYYFTFEMPGAAAINQVHLDFKQQNFDWRLQIEGSQDQNEWFSIVEAYRILSIKNEDTDYQFTTINFPSSKYRYLRVLVTNSKEAPVLTKATITMRGLEAGTYRTYALQASETVQNKETKQTEIELLLSMPAPLSQLNMEVLDTFDYYRPVTIQYCTDSIKTEKGWKYNYRTLASGTLNSLEENTFPFGSTIARRLKIVIHNQDNQALNLGAMTLKGYVHQLVARFNVLATYYLTYGNKYAAKPQYDIARFPDKIPSTTSALSLGQEQVIDQAAPEKEAPLFENKVFLWVLMLIIIAVLGGFTLKMMGGK